MLPHIGAQAVGHERTRRRTTIFLARARWLHGRVTAFVVPMDAKGISLEKYAEKMGVISVPDDDVLSDTLKVPEEGPAGEEGKRAASCSGRWIRQHRDKCGGGRHRLRGGLPARCHAIRRRTCNEAPGKPIAEHQAIAFKLADMQTKIRAARLLVYEVRLDKDQSCRTASEPRQALRLKVANEVVCMKPSRSLAAGEAGEDHPVERYYRDARVTEIYEGTSEIQRLGHLPKHPRGTDQPLAPSRNHGQPVGAGFPRVAAVAWQG